MYAASLFVCTTRKELDAHAKRLLTAQVVAVICFLLFPLTFSFERPEVTGISGWLIMALTQFDQPYNQAPSLHIALLVILWVLYLRHLPRVWVWPFHVLCALIGISVLTTYQHHFIDIPTGALLGWLCVWLWPLDDKPVFANRSLNRDPRAWRIAASYVVASLLLVGIAIAGGGASLWLFWPAASLCLVAVNYLYLGSDGFQKSRDGKISAAANWLYFPYLAGACVNSRFWTRNDPEAVEICNGVHLGRMPSNQDVGQGGYDAVVDLTSEFNKPDRPCRWYSIPCLDLLDLSEQMLKEAAGRIASLEGEKRILVTCALGFSRSALAVMAWLLISGRVGTADEAVAYVKQKRPTIVVSECAIATLSKLAEAGKAGTCRS